MTWQSENKSLNNFSTLTVLKAAHPGSGFSSYYKRCKMGFRFLLFHRFHKQMKAIFQDGNLQEIVAANPRIYEKIYREYIYNGATIGDRIQILKSHYQFVGGKFGQAMIRSVYVSQNFKLCTIVLPNDNSEVTVRLAYRQRFEKEGELTLSLLNDNVSRLYSVSFSVDKLDNKPIALIGCLIGPSLTDSINEELVKNLTKGMHGMRPKNLLFFLLQVLCRELGIKSILAIAAKSHVYGGRFNKLQRIKFDYDEFWLEVGGKLQNNKFISLPLHHEKRAYEDIKSNKRASYARRYAALDNMETQIQNTLDMSLVK